MAWVPVEGGDQDEVEGGRRVRVEADLQRFVVVRIDAEAGDETVNHQVDVLIHVCLTSAERLGRVEQQHLHGAAATEQESERLNPRRSEGAYLEVVEDALYQSEDDVARVEEVDVRRHFAEFDGRDGGRLCQLAAGPVRHQRLLQLVCSRKEHQKNKTKAVSAAPSLGSATKRTEEDLFARVARRARRSRVGVDDLFEDFWRDDEQHDLQRPHGGAPLVVLGERVQDVEEHLAALGQVRVRTFLRPEQRRERVYTRFLGLLLDAVLPESR